MNEIKKEEDEGDKYISNRARLYFIIRILNSTVWFYTSHEIK